MLNNRDKIIQQARELSALDRLELVDSILESLDIPDGEIERLWADEAIRRWNGYKSGEIGSVLAAEVFEKYKS